MENDCHDKKDLFEVVQFLQNCGVYFVDLQKEKENTAIACKNGVQYDSGDGWMRVCVFG